VSQSLWDNDQAEDDEVFIHRYCMLDMMRLTEGKTGAISKREHLIAKLLKNVASASSYLPVDLQHGHAVRLRQSIQRPKGRGAVA
jgi:hypothetical protein